MCSSEQDPGFNYSKYITENDLLLQAAVSISCKTQCHFWNMFYPFNSVAGFIVLFNINVYTWWHILNWDLGPQLFFFLDSTFLLINGCCNWRCHSFNIGAFGQEKTRLFDLWWSVLTFKCNNKKWKLCSHKSDYRPSIEFIYFKGFRLLVLLMCTFEFFFHK